VAGVPSHWIWPGPTLATCDGPDRLRRSSATRLIQSGSPASFSWRCCIQSGLARHGHSLDDVSPHLPYSLTSGLDADWAELVIEPGLVGWMALLDSLRCSPAHRAPVVRLQGSQWCERVAPAWSWDRLGRFPIRPSRRAHPQTSCRSVGRYCPPECRRLPSICRCLACSAPGRAARILRSTPPPAPAKDSHGLEGMGARPSWVPIAPEQQDREEERP
jgi:hypothetical protein